MKLLKTLTEFFKKYFFNPKWRCNVCGKELYDGKYFCASCEKQLPFNDGVICDHCGRKVLSAEKYCSTCKERLVNLDKCRSAFIYDKPINSLIKRAKYDGKKYLLNCFVEYLAWCYYKNYLNAEVVVSVPMTEKSKRKRGYNQSEILSKLFAEHVGVPYIDAIEKVKETSRQARLNRNERMKNLDGVFRVKNKKEIKGKAVIVVDDVTTTGATAENIAKRLKSAGAKEVYLLSVASVPPKEGY